MAERKGVEISQRVPFVKLEMRIFYHSGRYTWLKSLTEMKLPGQQNSPVQVIGKWFLGSWQQYFWIKENASRESYGLTRLHMNLRKWGGEQDGGELGSQE
jgi:hypothetical protein